MLFGHDTKFLEGDSRCRGFIEETKNAPSFPGSEREKDFGEMIKIRQQSGRKIERVLAQFITDVGNIIYLVDDKNHIQSKRLVLELLEGSSDMGKTIEEIQRGVIDIHTRIRLLAYIATFANWYVDTYYSKGLKGSTPKTISKERLDFVRQKYEASLLFIRENLGTEQDINWKSKFEHFGSNALCTLELCNL